MKWNSMLNFGVEIAKTQFVHKKSENFDDFSNINSIIKNKFFMEIWFIDKKNE